MYYHSVPIEYYDIIDPEPMLAKEEEKGLEGADQIINLTGSR